MLVVENRDTASAVFENLDDLLEPLVAWVQMLPLFVDGVISVFTDEHNPIDGKFATTQCQSFFDGGIEFQAVAFDFAVALASFAPAVVTRLCLGHRCRELRSTQTCEPAHIPLIYIPPNSLRIVNLHHRRLVRILPTRIGARAGFPIAEPSPFFCFSESALLHAVL